MPSTKRLQVGTGPKTSLILTPATITGAAKVTFKTPVYRSLDGEIDVFGPTIRVKAGESLEIEVFNNLTQSAQASAHAETFYDPMYTNMHTHGLHDFSGTSNQTVPPVYRGGDNVFVQIPAKPKYDSPMSSIKYELQVPSNHLPGLHWIHPHKHGASAIQTYTANTLLLVEDDPRWLPDSAGCGPLRTALAQAKDVLIHLALFSFAPPAGVPLLTNSSITNQEILSNQTTKDLYEDFANVQALSAVSDPHNPLCCDDAAASNGQGALLTGANSASNVMLVNGAFAPTIPMDKGRYERWRLVFTGYTLWSDLQILDAATKQVTNDCELLLVAKDGVYLLEAPRIVDHIYLNSASRAELLVKCNGAKGSKYILTAGNALVPTAFGPTTDTEQADALFSQAVLAHIEVTNDKANPIPRPSPEACKPLYPNYASDLQDAALTAANAMDKLFIGNVTFTGTNNGCAINGEPYSFPTANPIPITVGLVTEWNVGKLMFHPLHVHIQPFQIIELPPEIKDRPYTSWFKVGDRQDTLQIPVLQGPELVRVRQQPNNTPGYAVMHCHLLQHEDGGCMSVVVSNCLGTNPTDTQPRSCSVEIPMKGTWPYENVPSSAFAPTMKVFTTTLSLVLATGFVGGVF